MNESNKRDSKPERLLILNIGFCVAVAAILIWFSIRFYTGPYSAEDIKTMPQSRIAALGRAYRFVAFELVPYLAGGYLLIATIMGLYISKRRRLDREGSTRQGR